MPKTLRHFVVKKLREPTDKNVETDIEWICSSLGFLTSRDQDKTAYRIIKALTMATRNGHGMTGEELTDQVEPTIGSVFYHLKKLMKAGLVVKFGSEFELRMNGLQKTIEEAEKDLLRALSDIKRIAGDVDDALGLEHR
jgi:DNA-binding transcriptional ArsR family regulator